jgi:hypothetical protein
MSRSGHGLVACGFDVPCGWLIVWRDRKEAAQTSLV